MEAVRISDWIDNLQRKGRYGFALGEVSLSGDVSKDAKQKGLARLQKRGHIRRVSKEFYVILPVEYSKIGMIPVDWFLEDLMRQLNHPYYVGLLTAAGLFGAAHQQTQEYQVVIDAYEPAIRLPSLTIRFFHKSNLTATTRKEIKGHSGMISVSTPEATAFDLVRYANRVGGLNAVFTVLEELCETMTVEGLMHSARSEGSFAAAQRLGWLFDDLGQVDLADALYAEFMQKTKNPSRALLDPSGDRRGSSGNRWRIIENTRPEGDL